MGRRGPKPTSTEVLRLRGSWRGKNPPLGNGMEPGTPRCPAMVKDDPDAHNVWRRVVPKLDRTGVLTKLDAEVLGQYAILRAIQARCIRALAALRREHHGGDANADATTAGIQRRLLALRREIKDIEARYGMTPSDRARIAIRNDHGKGEPKASADPQARTSEFIKVR